ncbi:ExeA family protein, partial [Shewanella sp.]
MYKAFYGLNDNPFSIAPNPHYLFLSDRHREALAHLTYGLGETGGFVLLTGEVGTGKTTVSRCLLRQLPENTDTAFILNPALTELELLATLCDELKISYSQGPSLKQLTDLISQYLLANHEKGRNTVLIIDEAQHLKAEVLEQLRLLTNLETDTKKLLQVILIGQPELQQLLKRQELRQLAQRITARYHLLPLTTDEIGLYVQHRLQVANRFEPLFTTKAYKYLHKYSGGIPRLINLLCERALMAGYGQSKVPIDHHMVKQAAAEVLGEVEEFKLPLKPVVIAAAVTLVFASSFYGFYQLAISPSVAESQLTDLSLAGSTAPLAQLQQTPVSEASQQISVQTAPLTNTAEPQNMRAAQESLESRVLNQAISQSQNIDSAYAGLFGLWQRQPITGLTPCQAAMEQGLACHQQQGNWNSIAKLNYPAVVYLQDDNLGDFYGVLIEQSDDKLLLQLNEQQLWVTKAWFNRHFSGTFELLWQPSKRVPREISRGAHLSQVQWLENNLAKVAGRQARLMDSFDAELERQLITFQRQHGLKADGIAGSQTLVQLNLFNSKLGPRLTPVLSYRAEA